VNDELERMWKEAVMSCFKELSHYLPGGTEDIHGLPHNVRFLDWDLKSGNFEYKAGARVGPCA
jgi:hypothetical protein